MIRFALAVLLLGACATSQGTPQQAAQAPSASVISRGSAVSFGYDDLAPGVSSVKSTKPLPVRRWERGSDAVDMVLRPDVITADFAVREVRATSVEALTAARQSCAQVAARLAERLGRAVRLTPRSVDANSIVLEAKSVAVVINGVLEVDLPGEWDFWSRSQLFITLEEATAALSTDVSSPTASAVRFEDVTASVKDPELYRPLLIERWVAQARGFSTQAQTKEAPLALVNCTPPGAVTQVPVSVEASRLQLAVNCRIDVPLVSPRPATPAGPASPAAGLAR